MPTDANQSASCAGTATGADVARADDSRPRASLPLVVLATLATLAAMYVARDILTPVALSIFLALILRPLLRKTKGLGIPDIVSAFFLVSAVAAVFVVAVLMLAGQAQTWLAEAPQTIRKVSQMLPAETGPLSHIKKASDAVEEISADDGEKAMPVQIQSQDSAMAVLGVSTHFVSAAVIVFVLAFFLLALSDTLLRQAVQTQDTLTEKRNVVQTLLSVEKGISRYLLTVTIINAGLGAATAFLMWLLGVPNPFLWGVMAATLNYVPHVGAFLCMVILFLVGTVTGESLSSGLWAAGAFAVLTAIESYLVTPFVLSKSLQLSPLAVILSILFWGWLWGIAGGLMAAPILAMAKLICDQIESLQPYSAFLAGELKPNDSA